MRSSELSTQEPSTASGLFVRLRAFLRIPGGGASSSALRTRLALASASLAVALLCVPLSATTAQARTVCPVGYDTAGHCGPSPEGLAVDQSTGDLFVADSGNLRVDVFGSQGEFILAFGWGVRTGAEQLQTCTEASSCSRGMFGSGAGALSRPQAVAVEQSTHDVYVVDWINRRVQKFHLNPITEEAEFLLMFGGEVDKTTHADVCTEADLEAGDTCGAGVVGTANGQFAPWPGFQSPGERGVNAGLIAVRGATVYVADEGRVQEFDSSGNYTGQIDLPSPTETPSAIAVNSAGDLYTVAYANEVQKITPPASGTYTLTFKGLTTAPLPFNASAAEVQSAFENILPIFANTVAVDNGLDVEFRGSLASQDVDQLIASAGSVTTTVQGGGTVKLVKLGLTGVLLQTLDASGNPQALAINAADELYVRDYDPARDATQVLAYDEAGVQTDLIRAGEVKGDPGVPGASQFGGLALGEAARLLYLSDERASDVVSVELPPPGPGIDAEGESTTELLATTATTHALINPKSKATSFHFQYIDRPDFEAHGFAECGLLANPDCHETASEALPDPVNFEFHDAFQPLTGLAPETAYRYRAVATNEKGTVAGPGATLTTYPPALFSLQGPTAVGPTGATLHLDLDPEGLETHYRFQYVTQAHFEAEGFANPSTTPEAAIAASATYVPLSVALTELQPNTAYRYRALISNSASAGDLAGPDSPLETPPTVCPNQEAREEENSLSLPQCRAYEQVSPAYKAGFGAHGLGAAPSGERVLFHSQGNFAGDPTDAGNYLSRRTPEGWKTEGIDPPPALGYASSGAIALANEDLTEFSTDTITLEDEANSGGETMAAGFFRSPDGAFTQATPTFQRPEGGQVNAGIRFASADLSKLFLRAEAPLLEADTYPGAKNKGEHSRLYEVTDAGTAFATLRLLGIDPSDHVYQGCDAFGGSDFGEAVFNALGLSDRHPNESVSRDGSTVFFNAWSPALPEAACAVENANQVLARVNGAETVDLSQPQPSECGAGLAPAEVSCRNAPLDAASFAGASADGRKAFFVSRRQLTDDASEDPAHSARCEQPTPQHSGCNLYMYDFEQPAGEHLVDLSTGDSSGLGPGVTNVLDTSADGSHIYFTAAGLLTEKRNALGQEARAGAQNLYVYDTKDESVSFVAERCTETEQSGSVHDAQCLGSGNDDAVQARTYEVTPDGRYLLFATYAQLTPDDTNQASDVYRYDALTGSLLRVSVGHEEQDEGGNGGGQDASVNTENEMLNVPHRVISADGQTAVFYTARPLQESDVNGKVDAYLWHRGQVNLLSGGHAENHNGEDITLSASGRDVFFSTSESLVPSDRDGLRDVYDARLSGGFPLPPPAPAICETPEGCGRTAGPEPPPPAQGSASLQHGPEEPAKPCRKGFVKRHGRCIKRRRHHKKRRRAGSPKRANTYNRGEIR